MKNFQSFCSSFQAAGVKWVFIEDVHTVRVYRHVYCGGAVHRVTGRKDFLCCSVMHSTLITCTITAATLTAGLRAV